MSDNIVPRRLYYVDLLNVDIQKENQDKFVAENVKIGPSGVLECDRVFADSKITLKMFYNGQFHIVEMDREDVENFENPEDCGHHHEDEDEE